MRKQMIKKITILVLVITIFNLFVPVLNLKSFADQTNNSFIAKAGGALVTAIKDLVVFLADTVLELLQNTMLTPESIVITTDEDSSAISWKTIAAIVTGILLMVAAVVISVVSCGAASPILVAALGVAVKVIGIIGAATAIYGGLSAHEELASTRFDIPMIRYTPFEIFSGQIPLLDVNFINPMDNIQIKFQEYDEKGERIGIWQWEEMFRVGYPSDDAYTIYKADFRSTDFGYDANEDEYRWTIQEYNDAYGTNISGEIGLTSTLYGDAERLLKGICNLDDDSEDNYEELFIAGEIEGDANEHNYNGYNLDKTLDDVMLFLAWLDLAGSHQDYSAASLNAFGWCESCEWYTSLPCKTDHANNDTADSFIAVNIYVDDIRYLICIGEPGEHFKDPFDGSPTLDMGGEMDFAAIYAGQFLEGHEAITEEYQSSSGILQRSVASWYKATRRIALVALLSILVYIGIRIVLCSSAQDKAKYKKMIVDWVAAICILYILHFIMSGILNISSEISRIFGEKQQETIHVELPNNAKIDGAAIGDDAHWCGSFVGYARLVAGYKSNTLSLAYAIMYVVMVFYTVMFTYMYLRRVLYMAFLTMIAPLIAITYPIDKIKDGNAQAFGLWLREFIFNALLQPIHLILYVIIIGNAMDLAVDYPIYAILALGFMLPAEKFLRKMFGFEKAGTVSQLGAAAGGALIMSGLSRMAGFARGITGIGRGHRGAHAGGDNVGQGGQGEEGTGNVRTVNNPVVSANAPGTNGDSTTSSTGGRSTSHNEGGSTRTTSTAGRSGASTTNSTRANTSRNSNASRNGGVVNSTKPKSKKGKFVRKGLGNTVRGLAQVGRLGIKTAGFAGKIIAGGAGLAIGAGVGIASGEGLEGALKYGAVGTTGGATIASGATNLATGAIDGVENLAERSANTIKNTHAKTQQNKDIYREIKDSKARDLARDMNLSPEVASLSYRIATSISGDALYDDDTLKKMIASSGADSATQKQMLEYIKKFR